MDGRLLRKGELCYVQDRVNIQAIFKANKIVPVRAYTDT